MVDSQTWEATDFDVSFLGQMGKDSIIIPSKPTPTSEPVLLAIYDSGHGFLLRVAGAWVLHHSAWGALLPLPS